MLSVIIPLAPGETAWPGLVSQLRTLPEDSEIILAHGDVVPDISAITKTSAIAVRTVSGKPGRASQMNSAARSARGRDLWFLHADCLLDEDTVRVLLERLVEPEAVLWFHDLAFLADGPGATALNALGVRFRSNVLKMPFGDQGFCLSRDLFMRLGGYPQDAPYGEDHLLVWRALQAGVPVRRTGAKLFTSARKYASAGWLKTTSCHVFLWLKQAFPELLVLLKGRRS